MSTFIDENELDLTTTTKSDLSSSLQPNSFSPSTISSNTIITIPDKSHSVVVEKPVKKVRLSEEINREKKYDDAAFDQYDLQRQIRASIVSLPADVQFPQSIEVSQKQPWFLSKLFSFSNWKKSNDSPVHSLKLFEIYKYADRFDIILMVIGTIAALGVGACYPILFFLYRQLLDNFTDFNQNNGTINSSNTCVATSNGIQTGSSAENIRELLSYYVLLGFLSIILIWIAWTTWIVSAERQIRRIRFNLFRNILRQEIGWFDLHNTGELTSRLITDLDKMKDGMSEKVPDFIALFARMIGSLIYSLIIGWKLTLVYLSISPLIILMFNVTIKTVVRYTMKEVKAFTSASAVAQEVLQNLRTVTIFHGQAKEEQRFANNLVDAQTIGVKKGIYLGLCQCITSIINYSAFAIVVWYGPYLARTECYNYSAGTVIVVFFGITTATMCIAQCIPNVQNFAEAASSGVHVLDIINRQTKIDASSNEGDKPDTVMGRIQFQNVNFAYPTREETTVLCDLSFEIPPGKTVALVGPSGCGKSTTIQLIQRFYDPDYGQILLDGRDLKTLNVSWLRSQIGIVSQEPVLFTGSIEENIRMGKPDATDEEVQNAAKIANAHEFIMALPEKYKTTSGDKLSGGQKQRVAIARALISNPKILLLDEATSALDNTSERLVQDALKKAKEGRTTIVIAHRLSTIRNADLIIGLEHGEVVECGSHDELMEKKGLYYELVVAQTGKETEDENDSDSDSEDNETTSDVLAPPVAPVDQRISRLSIFSIGSDIIDEHMNELAMNSSSNNRGFFHTPFLYKIAKFNAPEWRWILLGTLVSITFGCSSPLYGFIFANLYSAFGEPNVAEQERITRNYALIAFFIGLGSGISQYLTSLSFAKSGEALTMRMRKLIFSAILRQEMNYFDHEANTSGALVTRLSSDASALKGLTGIRVGIVLQSISAVVLGLALGFTASWKITLVILSFSPLILLLGQTGSKKGIQDKKSKNKDSFIEQGGQHALQAIEQIRTVVALHQENHFIDLYEQAFNHEFQKQIRQAFLTALRASLANSLVYFVQCASFGYGRTLVMNGEIQYTDVYRVYAVVYLVINSVARCISIIPDYSKAKAAALRIMKLNKRESSIDPTDDSGIILDNIIGDIEFRDISFRYPHRATLRVLRHLTLKCINSQTTAIVGPSGSGKSTLLALLQRLYDPRKGKILLDGHDIKVLNIRWLRSLMGVVQQEPVLFNLSIRENIAYGDNSREVTQEEIENAAQMANIHDVIISLPQGYETLCGAKGNQLSGGQKQRIAIARALIRNPKILLLDEATSALDNKSEQLVQATLNEARAGRTCLTIAHRLSTIHNSEKIAVVNRGKMNEEGTHEQLLRQNGTYAKLALAQERTIKDS